MNYIGKIDSIVRPVVTMNGVNVVAARVTNTVGKIPTCSVLILPEDVENFDSPDKEATLEISGEGGSGTLFTGYITGINFSNMNGRVSAGVDIIHKARDLDETSALVPGMVSAGNVDIKVILYHKSSATKGLTSPTVIRTDLSKPFMTAVCETITSVLERATVSSSQGFVQSNAGDKQKAIAMIKSIGENSQLGNFTGGGDPDLEAGASRYIYGVMCRANSSSTMWDVLSEILAGFDCMLVCKPDGTVVATPNFSGIASQGNAIDSQIITKFDKSSLTQRSPKETLVVSNHQTRAVKQNVWKQYVVGHYSDSRPGSRGSLYLNAPGWISSVASANNTIKQKMCDKLAEVYCLRYAHKMDTINIVCPVCPDVYPGTSATFTPASSLKNFRGMNIGAFETEFDGYCSSITHTLASDQWATTFAFEAALSTKKYQKQTSHPFFEGAKMIEWT
jgi:hypothetical protein